MSFLYLVRHGQGTLDGGPYDQLSELGKVQSKRLGDEWVKRIYKFDYAYAGTLNRHLQTAELVRESYEKANLNFPELALDEGFNEIDSHRILTKISARLMEIDHDFRDLSEKAKAAFQSNSPDKIKLFNKTYKTIMDAWINNEFPDLDGVSWNDYNRNVLDTSLKMQQHKRDDRIVVFTSGNPMGIYIKKALNLSDSKTMEIVDFLYNTNVTTFIAKQDSIILVTMNETSHLTDDMKTRR